MLLVTHLWLSLLLHEFDYQAYHLQAYLLCCEYEEALPNVHHGETSVIVFFLDLAL